MIEKARLWQQLKMVPLEPGVYIYKDREDKIIYVGKAKALRNRMRSYFQSSHDTSPKTRALVERIAEFEFYVTSSEVEALVLEYNLIKKYRPTFNIAYRDDKSYPYIAITWRDNYPRIYITREQHRRGTKYYGPYTSSFSVRETFEALRRIFSFRSCKHSKPGRQNSSPCLNYHINRCLGPCIEAVNREDYRSMIKEIELFLEGRTSSVVGRLEEEMNEASAELDFEQAAKLRDRLAAAHRVLQKQKIVSEAGEDFDVVGISFDDGLSCVNLSIVRDGKLIGSENFIFEKGESTNELARAFLIQHYGNSISIPPTMYIPSDIEDQEIVAEWLGDMRGAVVNIKVPQRGLKLELLNMATKNASHALGLAKTRPRWDRENHSKALESLAEVLQLPGCFERIECFDISTIQGRNSVGSMVVFVNGKPSKNDYRKFKIKFDEGINDYAMMHEVITRRLAHLYDNFDPSFAIRPDIIIVDGGKPQLSAALKAQKEACLEDIPIIGLAKREEEIFMPGQAESIKLDRNSEALKLIQRIRDEAHRFALAYHRNLRTKSMIESTLDKIPGVGEQRKKLLLQHFGSPAMIASASLEDLKSVPGLPNIIAERVYKHFRQSGGVSARL